jgi:transposase
LDRPPDRRSTALLSLSHCQRIFLARAPADMRKGFDGLASLVRERLGKDPLSGDAFVFVSRRRSMLKILLWDVSGFWLATKRLERGTFAVRDRLTTDREASGSHALSVAEMMNLLEGIEIRNAAYHQHYSVVAACMDTSKSESARDIAASSR